MRQPRQRRVFQAAELITIWTLGVVFVLAVGLLSWRADLNEAEEKFYGEAEVVYNLLTNQLSNSEVVLTTLTEFYQASEFLSSSELAFTADKLLNNYPFIESIAYLRWTPKDDRESFEQSLTELGFPQFNIHPLHATNVQPSAESDYYLPVSFLEPLTPRTARFLGADALSDPDLTDAITAAIQTADSKFTFNRFLEADRPGYLMLRATYLGQFAPTSSADREQQVSGLFLFEINPLKLLDGVHDRYPNIGILLTREASAEPTSLAIESAPQEQLLAHVEHKQGPLPSFTFNRPLRFSDHQLSLTVHSCLSWGDIDLGRQLSVQGIALLLVLSLVAAARSIRISRLDRQRNRDAILQERERAEVTLHSIGEGVITTDTELRVLYMNPVAETLSGKNNVFATGRRLNEVATVVGERSHRSLFDPAPESLSVDEYIERSNSAADLVLIQPDGTEVAVDHFVSRLRDLQGVTIGAVIVLRDIGRERQLAQKIAGQTKALEVANANLARTAKAKDEFLAAMSHELRTPLNAILGLSEAMQEEVFGTLTQPQREALTTVERSGTHLLSLINDILDIARVGAGSLPLDLVPIVLREICDSSLNLIKPMAAKKQIAVSLRLADTPLKVQADRRRLIQMLVNLLSNAVKFTPDGGSVGLDVSTDPSLNISQFCVWDTGIGIAEEHLETLFQAFVQVDSRLSREYEGTGLGLSLVHQMAQMHGGRVDVESKPGVGSKFTLTLPLAQSTGVSQQPSETRPSAADASTETSKAKGKIEIAAAEPQAGISNKASLLLAEDNEANIEMILRYLTAKGYPVSVARNGKEAISAALRILPDLILMDIQMPGTNGFEAIRAIRNDATLKDVPIIALTAMAMAGDRQRCLDAGANEYVKKPVRLRHLVELIETFNDNQDSSLPPERVPLTG